MSARENSRFTTAQAGWIALAVFAAWLAFLFVPAPRKARPPASTELPPLAAQSKLEAAGLTNNSDWRGLPGYFALWADSIEWEENRTYFAYWNPGSYSYSYFFEATRGREGIRFRSLTGKPASPVLYFDESELAQFAEGRKADSPTHPFVFQKKVIHNPPATSSQSAQPIPDVPPGMKVEVNIRSQPIPAPAVNLPEQPDAKPKK